MSADTQLLALDEDAQEILRFLVPRLTDSGLPGPVSKAKNRTRETWAKAVLIALRKCGYEIVSRQDEALQQEEATTPRPDGEVSTQEAQTPQVEKTLIADALEWKRRWRAMEGKPPNAYADDILMSLGRAVLSGELVWSSSQENPE